MNSQTIYNPYNTKNRLFTKQDIQAILKAHGCDANFVKNVQLYQTAMVHSSYVKRIDYTSPLTGESTVLAECPQNSVPLFDSSYERLEHLGDSVLGVATATYLSDRFPDEDEGFLTDLRKDIVCNDMLGSLCQKMGLDKFYIISKHNEETCNGRSNTKKLGDILEAFLGALWKDTNYNFPVVYKFVTTFIEKYIDIPKLLLNNRNFKNALQNFCQAKYHYTPKYIMLSSSNGIYTMAVTDDNGNNIGVGSCKTKKQAEQNAAQQALKNLS